MARFSKTCRKKDIDGWVNEYESEKEEERTSRRSCSKREMKRKWWIKFQNHFIDWKITISHCLLPTRKFPGNLRHWRSEKDHTAKVDVEDDDVHIEKEFRLRFSSKRHGFILLTTIFQKKYWARFSDYYRKKFDCELVYSEFFLLSRYVTGYNYIYKMFYFDTLGSYQKFFFSKGTNPEVDYLPIKRRLTDHQHQEFPRILL